jgi:hypothetical protein
MPRHVRGNPEVCAVPTEVCVVPARCARPRPGRPRSGTGTEREARVPSKPLPSRRRAQRGMAGTAPATPRHSDRPCQAGGGRAGHAPLGAPTGRQGRTPARSEVARRVGAAGGTPPRAPNDRDRPLGEQVAGGTPARATPNAERAPQGERRRRHTSRATRDAGPAPQGEPRRTHTPRATPNAEPAPQGVSCRKPCRAPPAHPHPSSCNVSSSIPKWCAISCTTVTVTSCTTSSSSSQTSRIASR